MKNIKRNFIKTIIWFKEIIPMLLGIIIIIAILKQTWIFELVKKYINNDFIWVILSSIFWSISAWNSLNSYIIANNFWDIENHILIISSFLISWVTVWIIQIPAESYFFWKKFAITRNILSFIFSIIWAYIIYNLYYIF